MHAVEFEATAQHHLLHLPEEVPDGVPLRVIVLMEETLQTTPAAPPVRRSPAPELAGSVVLHDDLIAPAVPPDDWEALK